jgi:ribosomal protein S12 methylthiotransferase accessory factor
MSEANGTTRAVDAWPGPKLVLFGEGLLADAIACAAGGADSLCRADRLDPSRVPTGCQVITAATDSWDTSAYPAVRRLCADRGLPWLPVRAELGRVVIGPFERMNTTGCVECAELRRHTAHQHLEGYDAVGARHGESLRARPSSILTQLAADLVAGIVMSEVRSAAEDPIRVRTRNAMLYVDLQTFQVDAHRFLPDPFCEQCGDLPADDAALARIELSPRPKPTPDDYRVRAVADEMDALLRTYVDGECGLVRELRRSSEGGLVIAAAEMRLRNGRVESGWGRSRSYRTSELTALLEALERYGGMEPGGRRTVVHAAYREVRDQAVDPWTLGLHPVDSYRQPGFPCKPFDEDQPYRWVWAHSFAREAPILVPEEYAYYGLRRTGAEPAPFVNEISNGCALGGCLEEAILYGILEVAERDAFLMTWYAEMPVPRIDPRSARDRAIPTIIGALEAETGYRTMIFDTTLEQGIPCFWVMAVDPADEPAGPKLVCAAGSHLNPERAIENALSELGPILAGCIRRFPQERAQARRMAEDSSLVTEMKDHSLLNGDVTAFPRVSFLVESDDVRAISDLPRAAAFQNGDLTADLREVTGRYLDAGLDVIVVDQTTPEHRAGGFSCVKVIIPGMLPMTFGHALRRVDGLPRLYEVPRLLGYRDRRLGPDDINPHPHPFP